MINFKIIFKHCFICGTYLLSPLGLANEKGGSLDIQEKVIQSYPFKASKSREIQILNGYKKLQVGLSTSEVEKIMGEPEEIRPLLSPNKSISKIIGFTQWYVLQRVVASGSVLEKDEKLVRVSFGLDGRLIEVDYWGIDDIP